MRKPKGNVADSDGQDGDFDLDDVVELDADDTEKLDDADDNDDADSMDPDATIQTDNIGEVSVEINVEELIAEIEGGSAQEEICAPRPARKVVDDMIEEKRIWRELMDMEDLDAEDLS